ncbi:hypothetical protein [Marilutibacter alkalisoli]|uniref:Type II secretion system protein n=1 Tax=Marilutibacter alkalisoli TaxID=2591633 RepID=A0A514BUR3_9GAMM|nr:hypothetical protein [Lysobacter alkalisoli]QDH71143.1 hypothetical protein FKV23_14395 [Lysobacter alkalisoli]
MSGGIAGEGRWLAIVASVVVVATVVTAVVVMDPPSARRDMRIDEKRVRDLERIERAVRIHLDEHGALPETLAALARRPGLPLPSGDPVDGEAYGYEVTGLRSIRLCATFATDTAREIGGSGYLDRWHHPADRHCFDRRFDRKDSGGE